MFLAYSISPLVCAMPMDTFSHGTNECLSICLLLLHLHSSMRYTDLSPLYDAITCTVQPQLSELVRNTQKKKG